MNNQPKVQKIMNLVIQLVIIVVTYIFIYHQVFQKTDLPELFRILTIYTSQPGFFTRLFVILSLMIINLGLEAYKWKYLIGKVEDVSFFRACQAILTGISVSSFIPNRVGEFFGRIYILKTASRIEGILITVVGSMSQLLITILAGSAALLIFLPRYFGDAAFGQGYIYYSLVMLVLSLDFILLALFFKLSFLAALKEKILQNRLKKMRKYFRVFAFYKNREMATVVLLSLTRYIVFSGQFYLLLNFFNVNIPYFNSIVLIALIYLIMAILPTIALTELGIRGSVSLYIFGLYFGQSLVTGGQNNLGVFAASTLLWMINLGLPSVVGTIFVFRLKFFRKATR